MVHSFRGVRSFSLPPDRVPHVNRENKKFWFLFQIFLLIWGFFIFINKTNSLI